MTGVTPPESLEASGGFFPQHWPAYLDRLRSERPGTSVDLMLIDPRIEPHPPGFDLKRGWHEAALQHHDDVPCFTKDAMRVRCFRMMLRWPLTKFGVRAATRQGTSVAARETAAEALVEAAIATEARGGVCCYMQWTHAQGGSLGEPILYEPLRETAAEGRMRLVDEITGSPLAPAEVRPFLETRIRSVFGPGVTAEDFTEAAAGRPRWRGAS